MKQDNRTEIEKLDSIRNPSTRPMFSKHISKKIENWNQIDFFGWYLNEYKRQLGHEDPAFSKSTRLDMRMFGPISSLQNRLGKNNLRKYISFAIGKSGNRTTFYGIMSKSTNEQLLIEFGVDD